MYSSAANRPLHTHGVRFISWVLERSQHPINRSDSVGEVALSGAGARRAPGGAARALEDDDLDVDRPTRECGVAEDCGVRSYTRTEPRAGQRRSARKDRSPVTACEPRRREHAGSRRHVLQGWLDS